MSLPEFKLTHKEILKNLCRVCGQAFRRKQKNFLTSHYKERVENAFRIDLTNDEATKHPESFCDKCYYSMINVEKKGTTTRLSTFSWPKECHFSNCDIRKTFTTRAQGGRPKKSKKRPGRPSLDSQVWNRELTSKMMRETSDANITRSEDLIEDNRAIIELCTCVVCKDIYKRPVMLLCQHSFCLLCLVSHYEGESEVICEICKHVTLPGEIRPCLQKEEILAKLIYRCHCKNEVKLIDKGIHICTTFKPQKITKEMEKTARDVIKMKLSTSVDNTIEIASGGPNVRKLFYYLKIN